MEPIGFELFLPQEFNRLIATRLKRQNETPETIEVPGDHSGEDFDPPLDDWTRTGPLVAVSERSDSRMGPHVKHKAVDPVYSPPLEVTLDFFLLQVAEPGPRAAVDQGSADFGIVVEHSDIIAGRVQVESARQDSVDGFLRSDVPHSGPPFRWD